MLGQMMWFKRFCCGLNIEFDFAFDMDASDRNRHANNIHQLFFGEGVRENLRQPYDELICLRTFFERATSGSYSSRNSIILVDPLVDKTLNVVNAWGFHAFQHYCLEKGFLGDVFPYWASDLTSWTAEGALAHVDACPNDRPTCLIHMRHGDCVVLTQSELKDKIDASLPGPVYATNRFFSEDEFLLYQMGLHPKFPPRHYAERGGRLVKVSSVLEQAVDAASDAPVEFTFVTDGYTQPSKVIGRVTEHAPEAVEQALNVSFLPILDIAKRHFVGETGDQLAPTIEAAAHSDQLITGSSLFPFLAKYAVHGEKARTGWRCIDEMDSLSRYLQLPSLVDIPQHIFGAQLERLMREEV